MVMIETFYEARCDGGDKANARLRALNNRRGVRQFLGTRKFHRVSA